MKVFQWYKITLIIIQNTINPFLITKAYLLNDRKKSDLYIYKLNITEAIF